MTTNVVSGAAAPVIVEDRVLTAMRTHAATSYPYECCGALIASGDTIVEAFPLPNTTAEGAARRSRR
jgi:proteasome lid subunit RPN8/RPN11